MVPAPPTPTLEQAFRRRLSDVIVALTLLFSALAAWRYVSIGVPWLALTDGVGIVVIAVAAIVLRPHPIATAHMLTTTLFAVLVVDNSVTGGFWDPNLGWLYVVPLIAGALIPGRAVIAYGLVVGLAITAFFAVDQLGPGVPDLVPAADHASQSLFNRLAVMTSLVALVVAFVALRARTATALAEAATEANAANHAKSAFLANMSHELRTPLNAIIGFTELMLDEVGDGRPTDPTDLARVRTAARGLLTLVDEVLDLSKIEAGKLEIVPAPTDLGALLAGVATTLEPLVRAGGNAWRVELPPDLGVASVDPLRLVQIVTNLVGNAAKFTRDGAVTLTAARAGPTLRVEIRDTGIGIPLDKQVQVFDSFVQADSSTTRLYGGSGLGLAISRRLARLMGGDVVLDSVPGQGSRFTLTVPVG
ncbi:MAG: ATP-binding protein [Myxococcota bacterium]